MATPRRIEYAGPEGWTVWADEDGVHVRSAKGDCLESPDVTRLIALVADVRAQIATTIEAPWPPTPQERASLPYPDRDAYYSKMAQRAIAEAFEREPF